MWWLIVRYIWRVALQLLFIGITLLVFDRLQERGEIILVSLVGILYCTAGVAQTNATRLFPAAFNLLRLEIHAVRAAVDPAFAPNLQENQEIERALSHGFWLGAIQQTGLGIIGTICLVQLARTLFG